jgi:serine/threonine protein kinase
MLGSRFTVQSVLGIGGFGITYAAWDQHLQRHVAIKEYFPSDVARDVTGNITTRDEGSFKSGLERFYNEGRMLAQLRHPGVVMVFDVLAENNTAYIVMEYLVGETLAERLHRDGPLDPATVLNFVAQVCSALTFLHNEVADARRPVILHLDISPSNIMVVHGETGERAVLIDMGAARTEVASASHEYSRIVKAGFSPPELYSSTQPRTAQTDVYSLAATSYQLLSGLMPTDSLDRAQGASLIAVTQYAPTTPVGFASAIASGLTLQREARPASASAFLTSITQVRPPVGTNPSLNSMPQTISIANPPIPQASTTLNGSGSSKRPKATLIAGLFGAVTLVLVGVVVALLSRSPSTANADASQGPAARPTETTATDGTSAAPDSAEPTETVPFDTGSVTAVSTTQVDDGLSESQIQPVSARSAFTRASVRRKCDGSLLTFSAGFLIDGDTQTGWGASDSNGAGAEITIDLGRSTRLTRIGLTPGFLRMASRSDQNCAVVNAFDFNRFIESVEYRFDDGTSVTKAFDRDPSMQYLDVNTTTRLVTMKILSTSRTVDNDTIISDINFFGSQG